MDFSKKAILIGVSNVKPDLPGVNKDLIAYKNYLKSNHGGAWEDSEIITLLNKNKHQIKLEISKHTETDFLFMLVAGHGEFRKSVDDTVLCTSDTEYISMKDLFVGCKRQLMIIDVCRNIIDDLKINLAEESYKVEGRVFDSTFDFTRQMYRQEYIKLLRNTSEGVLQYYSCSRNQSAGDDGNGGTYSQYMLNAARTSQRTCNINETHNKIKSAVNEKNPPQLPTENIGRRRDFPPFTVRLAD